jgi:RimJ/RimL family protein N-acetyltransferase
MIADAKDKGVEKIWLATYSDNPRALELYRSRGFVVEGIFRKEEKVGRRYRDVVSMALFTGVGRKT